MEGEGDKMEMEGGDGEEEKKEEGGEGDAMGMGMMMENPHKYDDDSADYKGWANVPALFLRQATVNSYWGDLVKA